MMQVYHQIILWDLGKTYYEMTISESISVKSHNNHINLHALITKLLTAWRTMIKKVYGFDEVFNIFDEIDKNCNKISDIKPNTAKK